MRLRNYYKIVKIYQNPYIASRIGDKPIANLFVMLTKEQAYERMLDIYNDKFSDERPYASTWSQAVRQSWKSIDGANKTYSNGTRSIYWDSRIYYMQLMTAEEINEYNK